MSTLRDTTVARIRELRKARGLSQRELADRMNLLAVTPPRRTREDPPQPMNKLIDQSTIAKIENGKRELTLLEAFQFAYALDVAPIHLFVPTDPALDEEIDIGPTMSARPDEVRAWIRGDLPLFQDARLYFSVVPEHEFKASNIAAWEQGRTVVKTSPDSDRQEPPEWQGDHQELDQ